MKRLLPQIGLTYLSVLAVVFYLGERFACYMGAISLVLFIVFVAVKRFRKTGFLRVVSFVALLSCIVFIIYTNLVYDKTVDKYNGAEGVVIAQLVEEPQQYPQSKLYKFKAEEFNGKKCKFKFYAVTDDNIDIEPFEKISMQVHFEQSENNNDKSNGYFLKTSQFLPIENYTVYKGERRNLYYYAIKLRQSIRSVMETHLDENTADLCNALLVGDKYALSVDIKEDFIRTGTSHLIVVSGFHFSVLASVFLFLSHKIKSRKAIAVIPAIVFVLIYMLVTGCTPTVLRSAIMMLLCFLGLLISRDTSPLNSLSVAAIVVLLIFGPYSAGNLSLIFSFACTFSIIQFSPKIKSIFLARINNILPESEKCLYKWFRKRIVIIVSALSVILSAFIASFPISVIFFGTFSSVGVLSTFILSLPVQLLLVLLLIFGLCGLVPILSLLIPVLKYPIELLSRLILAVVKFLSSFEFSYVYIRYSYVYILIFLTLILVLLMYLSKSKYRLSLTVMLVLLAFASGELSAALLTLNKKEELNFYDVSDGIAVVYNYQDTTAVLMLDCSGEGRNYVIDEIERYSADIDFYACTNDTASSMRSMYSFAQSFAIKDVLLYDNNRLISVPDNIENIHMPAKMHSVVLSDNVVADYYFIGERYVIYLRAYDKTMLILPYLFDARALPENMRKADYIVTNGVIENYELLSCDTFILSAHEDKSQRILKYMYGIYNKAYLTSDSDVTISLGV